MTDEKKDEKKDETVFSYALNKPINITGYKEAEIYADKIRKQEESDTEKLREKAWSAGGGQKFEKMTSREQNMLKDQLKIPRKRVWDRASPKAMPFLLGTRFDPKTGFPVKKEKEKKKNKGGYVKKYARGGGVLRKAR